MFVRRWVLLASLLGSAVVPMVASADSPKKTDKTDKKADPKTPTGPVTAPAPSQPEPPPPPPEEAPKDMNGTDENPDRPNTVGEPKVVVVAPKASPRSGYPMEEILRPITLPQNMSEVSIAPHFEASDNTRGGYAGGDALRARYGITRQVQIGLTYVFAAIYHDSAKANPAADDAGPLGIHGGKAVGLDVTVLVTNFLGVKVGVPVYISPVAVSLTIGAPLKFKIFDKLAIGGMDDFLNIKLKRFAPTFYQEYDNALAAFQTGPGGNNTEQPGGFIEFSAYVEYQQSTKLALIGRAGIINELSSGASGGSAGTGTPLSGTTFAKFGLQWTPKKWVDLGASLGFDDLAHGGTFGPQGFLAVRI
jgi:hypothetical protein